MLLIIHRVYTVLEIKWQLIGGKEEGPARVISVGFLMQLYGDFDFHCMSVANMQKTQDVSHTDRIHVVV